MIQLLVRENSIKPPSTISIIKTCRKIFFWINFSIVFFRFVKKKLQRTQTLQHRFWPHIKKPKTKLFRLVINSRWYLTQPADLLNFLLKELKLISWFDMTQLNRESKLTVFHCNQLNFSVQRYFWPDQVAQPYSHISAMTYRFDLKLRHSVIDCDPLRLLNASMMTAIRRENFFSSLHNRQQCELYHRCDLLKPNIRLLTFASPLHCN